MKIAEVVKAYKALQEISNLPLPYKAARPLAKLKKALAEEVEVIQGMEIALVNKYSGAIQPNGHFKFGSTEVLQKFDTDHKELMAQESEIEIKPVSLSQYTDIIRVSADTICDLENVVDFGGE